MTWTDELRAQAIKEYKEAEPTAETSMEIVKQIAESVGKTPNGVAVILRKADVYIKTAPKESATKKDSGEAKEKKETKQESLDRLTAAIEALGLDADNTIISKLTGKAAAYFADTIAKSAEED